MRKIGRLFYSHNSLFPNLGGTLLWKTNKTKKKSSYEQIIKRFNPVNFIFWKWESLKRAILKQTVFAKCYNCISTPIVFRSRCIWRGIYPVLWWSQTTEMNCLHKIFICTIECRNNLKREKSLPFFSSGLSGTSGRTLLNHWPWHLDIWDCTLGRSSQIIPKALHGDHPHVFDKFLGSGTKASEEALHTGGSESCAVGDVCNHCDASSSQRAQKSVGPWAMHTLEKGEQVKVLAPVSWDSPKESVCILPCHAMAQESCLYCLPIKNMSWKESGAKSWTDIRQYLESLR